MDFLSDFAKKLRAYPLYRLTIILLLVAAALGLSSLRGAGQLQALEILAACTIAAVAADAICAFALKKKVSISESGMITGIIAGSIIEPSAGILAAVAVSAIAIASKHAIKHRGFPIFNPAAFGLVVGGLAFGLNDAWWAAPSSIFLIIAAAVLAWKQNKLALEIAFLVAWVAALVGGAALQGTVSSLSLSLGSLPLYLMAFMLLEPKTSPVVRSRQILYGAFIGVLGVAVLAAPIGADTVAVALLAGNVLKKLLDLAKI